MTAFLNWTALLLILVTSAGLLLSRDWRWSLGFLAAQYLCVFWLVQSHWPVSMAAAKLVTGWMACAALGITEITSPTPIGTETSWPQGRLFRLLASALVATVTFAAATLAVPWLGLSLPVAWGGLILLGMGLLHLGITAQPFRVVLGILTFLAGFEVLYAAVESSILVAALLAIVNLGLALAGAYFMTAYSPEEGQ
jgi:hypothetical protein